MWAPGVLGAVCVCLEGHTCSKPVRTTHPEVGRGGLQKRGGREGVDPPISDGLWGPSISLWTPWRPGWAFLLQPRACASKGRPHWWDAPTPSPSSSFQGFKIPAPLPRAKVGNQAPYWALVPQRAKGLWRNRFTAPPLHPSPLPAPLSALNKVC